MQPPHGLTRNGLTRSRNHAEIVDGLRRLLPKMESMVVGEVRTLPFGLPALDTCLPQGGLALGALHEVASETTYDIPSAFGFIAALLARLPSGGPLLLVTSPRGLAGCGRPHGHGLNLLGLDPARVILVETRDERHALWAMEEALRSAVPAAVAGAIARGLDLKTSQ